MSPEKYNAKFVPIFAPDGFPDTWKHDAKALYGDDPSDALFTAALKEVQHKLGLKVDGYCGPATIDAMADFDRGLMCRDPNTNGSIVVGPKSYRVPFPVVTYFDDFTIGDTVSRVRKTPVSSIVTHYDVSYSARSTEEILQNRGYSTHFIIDGDDKGTIYQCHNPTTRVAVHAGSFNSRSIGVDLNNPASPKYQKADAKRRGRERQIVELQINESGYRRLSYFPEQIQSFNALLDVLCKSTSVPRMCPRDDQGKPIVGVFLNADSFEGILGHYHLTRRKSDPAPLDWDAVCPNANT